MFILHTANRRLPEFVGWKGRRYPGQLPPLPPIIQPRRLELPPTFAEDWKRIGSKRTEFLYLGMPRKPHKLFMKPKEVESTINTEKIRSNKKFCYFCRSSSSYFEPPKFGIAKTITVKPYEKGNE